MSVQITEWVDSDLRRSKPASLVHPRLPMQQLLAKVQEQRPGTSPQGITWKGRSRRAGHASPGTRIACFFANPHRGPFLGEGEPRPGMTSSTADDRLASLPHRHRTDTRDEVGKAITGAGTLLFSGAARQWHLSLVAASLAAAQPARRAPFQFQAQRPCPRLELAQRHRLLERLPAAAHHHSPGSSCPTAWANNLLFTLTGNEPPPPREGPPGASGGQRPGT
jgi:hypothetical protein